jgi:hypothetical protein
MLWPALLRLLELPLRIGQLSLQETGVHSPKALADRNCIAKSRSCATTDGGEEESLVFGFRLAVVFLSGAAFGFLIRHSSLPIEMTRLDSITGIWCLVSVNVRFGFLCIDVQHDAPMIDALSPASWYVVRHIALSCVSVHVG